MGGLARVLLAAVLCGALLALGSAGAAAAEVAGSEASLIPWVPSESWPGGRQYDPRLERTVEFWGAGMPLREVFAGVKEQTGVEIGSWPPGDMNERVCVTLYLNAEKPPTLRELMAQVSWVTDCGFSVSEGVEGERKYCLLSTSIGQGAMEKLREERDAAAAARGEKRVSAYRDTVERVLAAVEECRSAVGLSQGELVRRYRGKDDVLLLALLDPKYRAGVEVALSVPRAKLESIRPQPWVRRTYWALGWKWCELTREQRDGIGVALGIREEEVCWDDEQLTDAARGARRELQVGLGVSEDVIMYKEGLGVAIVRREDPEVAIARREYPKADDRLSRNVEIPLLPQPGAPASAETDLRIRQLLGESITQEEIEEAEWSYWRLVAEQDRASTLRATQRGMVEHRALSEETEHRLAAVGSSVPLQTAYSLWQLQEAAAAASGMHVVSDCFWQPEQSITSILARFPRGDTSWLSLLNVLTLGCGSVEGVDPLRRAAEEWWTAEGWWRAEHEWGDAGEFLRFRSLGRAAWREAFLPESVLSAADRQLEAALAESGEPVGAGREVGVPVSVRELARAAAATSQPQQRVGGMVIYGDPADRMDAYRQPYLSGLLRVISGKRSMLGSLAELSDEEWGSVEGAGLHDVSVEARQGGQRAYVRFDVVRLVPLSMCPTPELADWWAENWVREEPFELEWGLWDASELAVLYAAGEGRAWVELFPTVLRVKPKSTERLVGAEPGG